MRQQLAMLLDGIDFGRVRRPENALTLFLTDPHLPIAVLPGESRRIGRSAQPRQTASAGRLRRRAQRVRLAAMGLDLPTASLSTRNDSGLG